MSHMNILFNWPRTTRRGHGEMMVPQVGGIWPDITRSRDDFPAPFRPTCCRKEARHAGNQHVGLGSCTIMRSSERGPPITPRSHQANACSLLDAHGHPMKHKAWRRGRKGHLRRHYPFCSALAPSLRCTSRALAGCPCRCARLPHRLTFLQATASCATWCSPCCASNSTAFCTACVRDAHVRQLQDGPQLAQGLGRGQLQHHRLFRLLQLHLCGWMVVCWSFGELLA